MSVTRTATTKKRGRAVPKKLPRERLAELRERAGYSVRAMSKLLGYPYGSAYHRYELAGKQKDRPIRLKTVRELLPVLVGRGRPPITAEEVMALSEVDAFPSKLKEYFTPEAPASGALPVRYHVEPGVYLKAGAELRDGMRSFICASPLYPADKQFVVLVKGQTGTIVMPGDQIHCVHRDEFSAHSLRGRKVVVAAQYKGSDLVEVVLAEVDGRDNLIVADGSTVNGEVLGVLLGVYVPANTVNPRFRIPSNAK